MEFGLLLEPLRAVGSQIGNVLNAFRRIMLAFFYSGHYGMMGGLVDLITSTPYLLVGLSLVIIGFVIAILKRLTTL